MVAVSEGFAAYLCWTSLCTKSRSLSLLTNPKQGIGRGCLADILIYVVELALEGTY